MDRMNDCVPDFEMDDDYSILSSSRLTRPKKASLLPGDNIMELLWQNGQVVMQSQNQRSSLKKSASNKLPINEDAVIPAEQSADREMRPSEDAAAANLFMQEDEMASWLHYPLDESFDRDFCTDLLYSAPCVTSTAPTRSLDHRPSPPLTAAATRPPIPPGKRTEVHNFSHFSRSVKAREEIRQSDSDRLEKELTVVDSSETPAVGPGSKLSHAAAAAERRNATEASDLNAGCQSTSVAAAAGTSSGGCREMITCDLTVSSSPSGSGTSASAEPTPKPPANDRKRKARKAADDAECHGEDVELESADAKKQVRARASAKRSRAAEVHNLSERRRRDRINEKMKALQELIPRCNKSDKASMLDEAIEYLKSLQLQVQMMSMGCSMVPMMFPGVQQYMPPMGMGMGMGMGMEMGLSRPMMPFPPVLTGSALPPPAAAAHLGARFPMPAFHMPPDSTPDPSRIQATNQSDAMLNSIIAQNTNQPRVPNFADPYQQYLGLHQMQLGLHQMQLALPQNQALVQTSTRNTHSGRGPGHLENHQAG